MKTIGLCGGLARKVTKKGTGGKTVPKAEIGQDRWMIGIGPIAKELLAPSVPNGEGIVD